MSTKEQTILVTKSLMDVAVERSRQIKEEGFDTKHDAEHDPDELPRAAASYLLAAGGWARIVGEQKLWPWSRKWWKPAKSEGMLPDVRRCLIKGAALAIAALEKHDNENPAVNRFSRSFFPDDANGCSAGPTYHRLDTRDYVRIYPDEFYPLHNFSAFTVNYRGKKFPTAEHAYQWAKFDCQHSIDPVADASRAKVQELIFAAQSAHDAFKIAEKYHHLRVPYWNESEKTKTGRPFKVEVMKKILREKANQHEYVARKLLETGTREIVEDSWRDPFWGRDVDAGTPGENWLGVLWAELRPEIAEEIRSRQNLLGYPA